MCWLCKCFFRKDNKKETFEIFLKFLFTYFFCCSCLHQIKKSIAWSINQHCLLSYSLSFKTKHSTPYIPSEWLVWGPIMAGTAILISQEHPIVQWVTFFRLLVIERSLLEPNQWHQNQSTIVKLQARFGSNNPQIAKQKIEPLGLVNLIDPLLITFTRWELFSKRLCYIEMILLYLFSLSDCTWWCAARACLFRDHIRLRDRNLLLLFIAFNKKSSHQSKVYSILVVDLILFSSFFFFFHFSQNWRSFKKDWKRLIDATFLSTVDIRMERLTQMH